MNIIHEQRESIINDNNNAQTDFVSILNGLKTNVTEINVKIPLQGELDLSILSEKGFERRLEISWIFRRVCDKIRGTSVP